MNAQPPRNRRMVVPVIALTCAGILTFVGLASTGTHAEGVPTPSATTVVAETLPAPPTVHEAIVVPPITPTGTTLPIEP